MRIHFDPCGNDLLRMQAFVLFQQLAFLLADPDVSLVTDDLRLRQAWADSGGALEGGGPDLRVAMDVDGDAQVLEERVLIGLRALGLMEGRTTLRPEGPRRGITLGGRSLDRGAPCFVIAEAGVNHNGDLERALALVDIAAEAGADAVKFQTFQADALASRKAEKAAYQVANTGEAGTQLEMLRKLELDTEAWCRIQEACERRGILFLSTPFDLPSAQLLADLGIEAFKIASGELTNLPFLREVASFRRPMILSTGMGDLSEVGQAVRLLGDAGVPGLALLHCLSAYPAPAAEYNLRSIETLAWMTGLPVGLSDHSMGWELSLGAVALGARILEKHFTQDRGLPGPDHAASLEPGELASMIKHVRNLEAALGDGLKRPMPSERSTRDVARKSLVARWPLPGGHVLQAGDLTAKRPGHGIPPAQWEAVLGRRLRQDLEADVPLEWHHLESLR